MTEAGHWQDVSRELASEGGVFRKTIEAEELRVAEVLGYGGDAGAYDLWFEERQAGRRIDMAEVRDRLIGFEMPAIDRLAIDARLGVASEDSILPAVIRQWYQQKQSEIDDDISFITWMTDHATDDQLTNVLQWHDDYLWRLDHASEFIDRISRAKEGYLAGLNEAIVSGNLHERLWKKSTKMIDLQFRHGSPLSPMMAMADAHVIKHAGIAYVWDGIGASTLYHEITHIMGDGLIPIMDEGATDLIAGQIYDHTPLQYRGGEEYKYSGAYRDNVGSLKLMDSLSGGRCDLVELSKHYAGDDAYANTAGFLDTLDRSVGLALSLPLVGMVNSVYGSFSKEGHGKAAQLAFLFMQRTLEALNDVLGRAGTEPGARSVPNLIKIVVNDCVSEDESLAAGWVFGLLQAVAEAGEPA